MKWKYLFRLVLIALLLIILIPMCIYVLKLDWSRQHTAEFEQLPVLSQNINEGSFRLSANDMEFLVRVAGWQNEGPAVVLLHGFPESSIMWSDLSQQAANGGYRVLSFDQRGYSPLARPKGVGAYHLDSLVNDVLAVTSAAGIDSFHLVGHDWGAVVGWKTVMDYPERIKSWAALSIPHIGIFFRGMVENPEQKEKSAYVNKLKIPYLPELLYTIQQKKYYEKLKGIWTDEQINEYQAIQNEPGANTAIMNWYRAMDNESVAKDPSYMKAVMRPTLFILGDNDRVVARSLIPKQALLLQNKFRFMEVKAGHSLMQMAGDKITLALLNHWSEN